MQICFPLSPRALKRPSHQLTFLVTMQIYYIQVLPILTSIFSIQLCDLLCVICHPHISFLAYRVFYISLCVPVLGSCCLLVFSVCPYTCDCVSDMLANLSETIEAKRQGSRDAKSSLRKAWEERREEVQSGESAVSVRKERDGGKQSISAHAHMHICTCIHMSHWILFVNTLSNISHEFSCILKDLNIYKWFCFDQTF
jgi:hypothetical protein